MPSSSIPENIVCERPPRKAPSIAATCEQMIHEQIPNLLRLYANPFVAQTCLYLDRYVQSTWFTAARVRYQSFLANSFEEALSGAIKLGRYLSNRDGRSPVGLVIDPNGRLGPFASIFIEDQGKIEFIPRLVVTVGDRRELEVIFASGICPGFVVLLPGWEHAAGGLQTFVQKHALLVIASVDRPTLATWRRTLPPVLRDGPPDVVIFDESFVNHDVPWAAFTARQQLFDDWNHAVKGTFHSTTFQPNTVSNLHFLRCLEHADPAFFADQKADFDRFGRDPAFCLSVLAGLYHPYLARTIAAAGFNLPGVRASGHYVLAGTRRIFDGVAGVACSLRGHNPPTYLNDVTGQDRADHETVTAKLAELTGLEHMVPAVSGASAVENALRMALAARFPRRYVLAFKGGFGGKTLLALAGTARASYKSHLDPLYEHVVYVDPYTDDVLDQLEAMLQKYPVAVVQLELIQAVGGVRPLPARVLSYLQENKHRWGYLLFVDEVQTGMYRAGPFVLAKKLGLSPDLLTVGKGASDMMFPFALTLYSKSVHKRLDAVQPELPAAIEQRYGYPMGYRTVLNALEWAEKANVADQVAEAGAVFAQLLSERLAGCKAVREVRAQGLLIAIELDTRGLLGRWLKKRVTSMYLLGMLQHPTFPVLVGFCQYEPHVLKLTPPLTINLKEIEQVCNTIASTLNRPFYRLLASALWSLARLKFRRRGRA